MTPRRWPRFSASSTQLLEHALARLEDFAELYPVPHVETALPVLIDEGRRLRTDRRCRSDFGA